jgi:hypothetical protein
MEYHLKTFSTWLREDMDLSDDIEICIDRAAISSGRKQRPTTRWDHLAKQQSFSMPKVPSRRRLGDTIDEKAATECSPRLIKQTSFCLTRGGTGSRLGDDGDEGTGRPCMGAKQTSLSSLPRQTSFKNLTEDEQKEMPRLLKQSSFKSQPRGLCDAGQTISSRPKHPSRPQRRCMPKDSQKPNRRPKLTVHKDDSNNDATTDTLSSMPRLVKQTSFTVAGHSSRGPLIGSDENVANGSNRRQQMAKQDSLKTMPRRPTRTFDSEDNPFETTNSLSSTRRLVEQAQHLYTKKAQVSDPEFRCGRSVARTKCPPSYAQYRDS